jgi:hypothetical protein
VVPVAVPVAVAVGASGVSVAVGAGTVSVGVDTGVSVASAVSVAVATGVSVPSGVLVAVGGVDSGVSVEVGSEVGVSVGVNVNVGVSSDGGVGVRVASRRPGAKHLKPFGRRLLNAHCFSGPLIGINVAEQKKPGPPKHCTRSSQGPIDALTVKQAVDPGRMGQLMPIAMVTR